MKALNIYDDFTNIFVIRILENSGIDFCSNFYIIFRIEEFFGCKQMEADANGWGRI
jgi:hypothetical protein